MSKPRYEPNEGVNQVSVGSIVVGPGGYTAKDDSEAELLDSSTDLHRVEAKHSAKPTEGVS